MKAPIAAIQIEISALEVSAIMDGRLDQAMRDGVAVLAWSPLARGGLLDPAIAPVVYAALDGIAATHGATVEAIALAFLQQHPASITPIIGSTRPDRISALAASRDITLTRREWYDILEAALGRKMP